MTRPCCGALGVEAVPLVPRAGSLGFPDRTEVGGEHPDGQTMGIAFLLASASLHPAGVPGRAVSRMDPGLQSDKA
jgi:hypothetical protein